MFFKFVKNSLVALSMLSYAATAISMEEPNNTVSSQSQIFSAEENLKNWELAEEKRRDKKAEEVDTKDSWASLSWWTKGLNTLLVAVRSYHLFNHWRAPNAYPQKGFIPIEQFIQSGEHPAVAQTLASVRHAMPIASNTYIHIDKNLPMPAAASRNLIYINPDLITLFNEKEREITVGHESRHVYHNDLIMDDLMVMASPFIAWGALKLYSKGVRYVLTAVQKKVDRDSKTYKYLRTLKTINTAISHNVITHMVLQSFLTSRFTRFCELRADREAAFLLNNPNAAISSIKKMHNPDFLKRYTAVAGSSVEDFLKDDAMSPYPLAMRIKALETLQQQLIKK